MWKLLVVLLFITPVVAYGSPTVSNVTPQNIVDGATLIISGTGFGSGPTIRLFDDFERGTIGSSISTASTVGAWTRSVNTPNSSDVAHSGSRSMFAIESDVDHQFQLDFPDATEMFLSYWVRIPDDNYFPAATSPKTFPTPSAWKFTWLMDSPSGGTVANDDLCLPTYSGVGILQLTGNDYHPAPEIRLGTGWWTWTGWNRISVWLKAALPNPTQNGTWWWQTIGSSVASGSRSQPVFDSDDNSYDDASIKWVRLNIPGWHANGGGAMVNAVYDDIYFATGPNAAARVEIGNNPIYANCTKLAIITPTEWSDLEITATIRQGGLSTGINYIFVIGSDNQPSVGKAVVFTSGSEPDIIAPTTTASSTGTNPITITLTLNESGTTYYTTDGSTPTTSSAVYTSPITITSTTTLKWFSRDTAGNQEEVKSATYTITPIALPGIYGTINAAHFSGTFR